MNRRPDSWEDPPEDPPEEDPMDDGDYAYDQWKDKQLEEREADLNRDCDYWRNLE